MWTVWNERNRRIFDNKVRGVEDVVAMLVKDFALGFRPCCSWA
jgi:hypothetical protein